MARPSAHILLLTGVPGVGKTTLIRRVAALLPQEKLSGFYTDEIRQGNTRQGFRLATFDGRERVMAHVRFPKTHCVGKYGVDIAAIDATVDDILAGNEGIDLFLVDEIGKMESLSSRFVRAMRGILDQERPVAATIARKGSGFIAEVKARRDAELWEVTRANRDELPRKVVDWLKRS